MHLGKPEGESVFSKFTFLGELYLLRVRRLSICACECVLRCNMQKDLM